MILVLVLSVLAAANGKATPGTCSVTEWGPWQPWHFPQHDPTVETVPLSEKTAAGAEMRARIMRSKTEAFQARRQCKAEGSCPQFTKANAIEGPIACIQGFADSAVEQWECRDINQQSFVPISEMGYNPNFDSSPEMNDLWGWTDLQTGDEYAIAGLTSGTTFIRVTDPQNPQVLGHLQTRTGSTGTIWRDMKVIGDYVFIVSEHSSHGMQVFDLTRLRGLQSPPQLLTADAEYTETGSCHNIVANPDTGFVYLVGCSTCAGLHVVDVSNPLQPQFSTCFNDDGYVHDAQCVIYHGPHLAHQEKEICFCYNENSFTIVHADDKTNMRILSRTGYSGVAYTHQGWVTDDHLTVLMDDELDEMEGSDYQKTYIWDIFNLEAPVLMNRYDAVETSTDHNQYIVGDLTYQANYEMGLRILSIDTDNYILTEQAYFDVYPGFNDVTTNGAWSVYPYFESGNIVVTSIQYGMFVFRPDYPAIRARIEETKHSEIRRQRTRYREILSADNEVLCPSLAETQYQ